jgi:hypothetical protein
MSSFNDRRTWQSQFKPNPKPIWPLACPASAILRPSTQALPRVAQDEADGSWQKEIPFILSHDAEHRESNDAWPWTCAPCRPSL